MTKKAGKNEFAAGYGKLVAKLPKITPPKGGKNDAKAKKLLQKADALSYFEGKEDSGLNEEIDAEKRELRREAKKYCLHKWKTTIKKDLTQDARLRVVRTITCSKCGMSHRDVVKEKV